MTPKEVTGPDVRQELLRQLRQAILARNISGGLRLVESARGAMAERNDSLAGQFRCLEARLYYASGDYQKALTASRMSASLLSPFGESEELGQAYLVSGNSLVELGNYQEAETAFHDAQSLFRRGDHIAGRIDAANQLARVYHIRGEYRNAVKCLLEAVRLAERTDDRRKLAYIWGNLGRVYIRLGGFEKATEALGLNLEILQELGDEREKAKSLLSLGYIEMRSEQYEKAEQYFDQSYLTLVKERMHRDLVIFQTYYGELRTRCGDYNAARRLLNEAIEGARTLAPESALMAAPLSQLAQLELACGKLTAASQLANKVLALSNRIGDTVEKGVALRILAQIAGTEKKDDRQTQDKINALFNQAIEAFDEIGASFEKAETLVIMAASQMSTSRRVFANLFRAAEIYQRLGITAKFEKTQTLINQRELPVIKPSERSPSTGDGMPVIITANRLMKKIIDGISHAAKSELPILICGDTGTGKDLLARYYHIMSGRRGEFVAINCAAFPDTLLEAEFFGYRKGAFTGANADKEGLIHRANGGTFFLDEIGEMSPISQAKLLTVIETCRARPLGGTDEQKLDIRFVAATNCDLTEMVEQGRFRRDLYYRLSGIAFVIPPLSERPEDIPLLVQHFLAKEKALDEGQTADSALISEFTSRVWPGNVRQLESEIKKLVLFSTMAREDSLGDLAGVLIQNDSDSKTTSLFNQVEQFERALILKALRGNNWNKSKAARSLDIHESTLRAKMKRYNLDQALAS